MSSTISLKLSSRSARKPIKKLPEKLEVPRNATVEEIKVLVAKKSGFDDFNRVGLFDPTTNKTLKNRKALIGDEEGVVSKSELLVQDLGPQIDWSTVFMIEYLGPILFHLLIPCIRPYIYVFPPYVYKNERETGVSTMQWLLFVLFQLHFFKREYETMAVHKFSANTMPVRNIVRNSAFYWIMAGLVSAWDIYAPGSSSDRETFTLIDGLGLVLFFVGEFCNYVVHLHLASLRKPGGTERGIPNCIGSNLVTSPNYMFEVMAWVGVIIISRSWAVVLFISGGIFYMRQWSQGKERALRKEFGDRYKKKRYTMLPGLI